MWSKEHSVQSGNKGICIYTSIAWKVACVALIHGDADIVERSWEDRVVFSGGQEWPLMEAPQLFFISTIVAVQLWEIKLVCSLIQLEKKERRKNFVFRKVLIVRENL